MRSAPCPRRSVEPSVAFEPEAWGILEVRGVTAPAFGALFAGSLGSEVEGLAVLLEPRGELGAYLGMGRCRGCRGEGLGVWTSWNPGHATEQPQSWAGYFPCSAGLLLCKTG